jgi:hypothetical protein
MYKNNNKKGNKMSKVRYTILDNGMGEFLVREARQTHTGVRWITLENTIAMFNTVEEAMKKYPTATLTDLGEVWWDNLSAKENTPSI